MTTKFVKPQSGFAFWPVGNGDSTTIFVSESVVIQIDLNHTEEAESEDSCRAPIVDELADLLPQIDGKPYLSAFVLSHPDEDHCRGFAQLLERVTIGELWVTPRVLREFKKELSESAKAFKDEAERRVKETICGRGEDAGNRVRIIGYDDLLQDEEYLGFPEERLTVPGNELSEIDGESLDDEISVFIHSPFKEDSSGERNDTSLGIRVELRNEATKLRGLFLGDLSYPVISSIFCRSADEDLEFDVLLAPHHCSKSVMYHSSEDDRPPELKAEIMEKIESLKGEGAFIISSSEAIPDTNQKGDNPPHAKAKVRYQERVEAKHFICTLEHAEEAGESIPIVVEGSLEGPHLRGGLPKGQKNSPLSKTLSAAAASTQSPPPHRVGFG